MKKMVYSSKEHGEIFGMARVGYIKNIYEIYVNTNDDGIIPHFHLRDKNDWSRFHTCIRIDSAEYFLHGNKDDKLNSSLKKALQNFMVSRITNLKYSDRFENNWELVCFLWDMNNERNPVPEDISQPDYSELD